MKSNQVDLSVNLAGIKMKNPIMTASGTSGFGRELEPYFDPACLGAIVSKGITFSPRSGNPQPRIVETPSGMINRIGLENPGLTKVIEQKIPMMAQYGIPVIINVSGFSLEEYAEMVKQLDKVKEVAAIEINVSCPNLHSQGKTPFGSSADAIREVVKAIKGLTSKPLIFKLTPNVTDVCAIAGAIRETLGPLNTAISLTNTFVAGFISGGKLYAGGLSGPAIKPMALLKVAQVAQSCLGFPVVGMGGITTVQDVIDFISVGATAVAIGTSAFKNPQLVPELISGLEKYCLEKGISNLAEIRGTVKLA